MSGHMPWFVAPDRKDLVFVPGVAQPMRCGAPSWRSVAARGGRMSAFPIRIIAFPAANDPFFWPDPMEAAA